MSGLLDDEGLLDLRRRAKPTDPAAVLAEERQRRSAGRPATPTATPLQDDQARLSSDATEARMATATFPLPGGGTCMLCGQRPARGQCASCGRHACAADLWVMLRLCRGCASDADVERGQRGARPEARNWLEGGA